MQDMAATYATYLLLSNHKSLQERRIENCIAKLMKGNCEATLQVLGNMPVFEAEFMKLNNIC